jgi:hypothetical protein
MIKYIKIQEVDGDTYKSNFILTNKSPMVIRIKRIYDWYNVYIVNMKTLESLFIGRVDNLKLAKMTGRKFILSNYGIVSNKCMRNMSFLKQ